MRVAATLESVGGGDRVMRADLTIVLERDDVGIVGSRSLEGGRSSVPIRALAVTTVGLSLSTWTHRGGRFPFLLKGIPWTPDLRVRVPSRVRPWRRLGEREERRTSRWEEERSGAKESGEEVEVD